VTVQEVGLSSWYKEEEVSKYGGMCGLGSIFLLRGSCA
jgi:hypothetical protein